MSFDPQTFKAQFPLFAIPENQQLIYWDNAATTQKPQAVIEAITHFYTRHNGNAQRSSHRLARAATEMIARVRAQACQFYGAAKPDEMIFTRGATEGLNLLAHALGENLQPGDEILLSPIEHHANLLPWQQLAKRKGLQLRFLTVENGQLSPAQLTHAITPRTRILSVTLASNVLGQCLDIATWQHALIDHPYRAQFVTVADATQWAAHRALAANTWPWDFLVSSAHKHYGPTGIGLLYGRGAPWPQLAPWQTGGEMVETVNLTESRFASGPSRFEAGTSPLSAIAGLGGCFDFLSAQDRPAMAAHESYVNQSLHQGLADLTQQYGELRLLTNPTDNLGIATLTAATTVDLPALGHWLDEHDIAVRVGDHCAQPLAQQLGIGKTLRLSVAAYNSEADIERTLEAIRAYFDVLSKADAAPVQLELDSFRKLPWHTVTEARSWQQRYKALLTLGQQAPVDSAIRLPENRVDGCESPAWLTHWQQQGQHFFAIDSDSRLVRGLAALLCSWLEGQSTAAILALDLEAEFARLGLDKHLSASRINGFFALKQRALALVAQN